MKLQEYQARQLLAQYDVPSSRGEVVFEAGQAAAVFARVANPTCFAKVQVQMGGRGKAGGVKRVTSAREAEEFAAKFLGKPFSTYQSAGQSVTVRSVLLTEDIPIQNELYLGIVIDRSHGKPVILFSKEGGVEIEEVASKNPDAIKKIHFSPTALPVAEDVFRVLKPLFPEEGISRQIADIAAKLAKLFVEKDASIVEINPLIISPDKKVYAVDAKMVFDDNALFRHEDIKAMKDPDEEDERERLAKSFGLSYVSMSGNVGCLVNGAGLAMATMDMIKLAGGEPANFLDVGGGATADQVREAFKIIVQDERVEAILVNIFGGIMKCDVIAEGVIQASREIKLEVPLVVRLEGTNVEAGRKLLRESGLKIHTCATIKEAADAAVQEAHEFRKSDAHTRR
ncbi:MAG TPA: ADP-forming succinate--CoA ligase subunit beta [Candidatus Eisenbacteria bacterium]|nr:ADP-forming succinate--CoA ligase subunit beta [Candidatus Eisenbacteria bacterium]